MTIEGMWHMTGNVSVTISPTTQDPTLRTKSITLLLYLVSCKKSMPMKLSPLS